MRNEAISEVSDVDLVAKALAGDASAFAHLVRRHAPIAKRMARLWGAGADADDVVQEAFVKAHAALARFRSTGGFRPWLLSIVHNETRNLHRGRGRRAAREALAQLPDDLLISNPEEEAMITDRRRRLLATIRELPVDLRVAPGGRPGDGQRPPVRARPHCARGRGRSCTSRRRRWPR